MAIAALEIPLINPLRFVPVDGEIATDARNNLIHFDQDWFVRYIRDWQSKTCYTQLWQFNDRIALQYHTNSDIAPTLNLIDKTGKIWHTWTSAVKYTVAGVQIKVGNGYEAANTFHFKLRLSDVSSLPEGVYLFHLVQTFDLNGDTVADYTRNNVSEPFSVAEQHYRSSRIDYYNTYNTQDILFTQSAARFSMRLCADVVDYSPASTDTNYEDGGNNPQLLASTPYRAIKYATTERIPEWVLDKLNRAWGCDQVAVDSKPFTKEPGAKWDMSRVGRVPKVMASLQIRESDNRVGARQVVASSVDIYTIPAYPYVVRSLWLNDSAGLWSLLDTPTLITDGTTQTAFLAAANATAGAEGFAGSFSVSGGEVIWTNAGGDLFLSGGAGLLTDPLTYSVTGTIAQAIQFGNVDAIIYWGDGAHENVNGVGSVSSTVHTYGASATYDIEVYGFYTAIRFDDGYLDNLAGKLPAGLLYFTLDNSFTITSFDATIFTDAYPTIREIRVFACSAMTSIVSMGTTMPNISYVSFATNGLSTTAVSSVVIAVYTAVSTYGIIGGSLYVNNQTPSAPLNPTAALNAADLVSLYGWQVYND